MKSVSFVMMQSQGRRGMEIRDKGYVDRVGISANCKPALNNFRYHSGIRPCLCFSPRGLNDGNKLGLLILVFLLY